MMALAVLALVAAVLLSVILTGPATHANLQP